MVAVKKLYDDSQQLLEQFFREDTIVSHLRHQNLVALFDCTSPHSLELLLVFEFVPNDTVADHLHVPEPILAWDVRIQIVIQTAEALKYLHFIEPIIIHRDVKTSNIHLNNEFNVKVANMVLCRLLPLERMLVSTVLQDIMGYRNTEYDPCFKLTDRSDVYSFGMVLLELISGRQTVDVNRGLNEIYVTKMTLHKTLNNELEQLVDTKLGYHSNCMIRKMVIPRPNLRAVAYISHET